jgi:hypothetical protein
MGRSGTRSLLVLLSCLLCLALVATPTLAFGGPKEEKQSKEEKKAEKEAEKQAKEDAEEESSSASSESDEGGKDNKEKKDKGDESSSTETQESNESESQSGSSQSVSSSEGSSSGKDDKKSKSKGKKDKGGSSGATTATSSSSSGKDSKGKGGKGGGGCVEYYFRYTDGHVDSDTCWTGGNDIYRSSTPSLHVLKLHVSCSDTIYPDGTAEKAELDGHLVAEWYIIKEGKQCQGFETTAPPLVCPEGTDMAGQPMPPGGVKDCDQPPPVCPSGTDMAGQPVPPGGVSQCNRSQPPVCPNGTEMAGMPIPPGGIAACDRPEPAVCPDGTDMAGMPIPPGGVAACVLGTRIERPPVAPAPEDPAPAVLPFTGSSLSGFVIAALVLLSLGLVLLRAKRTTTQ